MLIDSSLIFLSQEIKAYSLLCSYINKIDREGLGNVFIMTVVIYFNKNISYYLLSEFIELKGQF